MHASQGFVNGEKLPFGDKEFQIKIHIQEQYTV